MKKILLFFALCLIFTGTALAQDDPAVRRAVFATGIENREPVESVTEYFPAEGGVIYFFTELANMQDNQVVHVWSKNGEEIYRFTSNVGAPRWRTSSSMKAAHFQPGDEVTVEVIGPQGDVYETKTLSIR